MLVLGVASCILGLLPVKLSTCLQSSSSGRGQSVLQLLLCFGGGALLCTTFLHLLPEVRESIETLQHGGEIDETDFHLPELIMCCGFFLMFLVEELIHVYLHHRKKMAQLDRVQVVIHRSLSIRRCSSISGDHDHLNTTGRRSQVSLTKKTHSSVNGAVVDGNLSEKKCSVVEETVHQSPLRTDLAHNSTCAVQEGPPSSPEYQNVNGMNEPVVHEGGGHKMGHDLTHVLPDEDGVASAIRGLLVVLALSIHELFEGLAVGLQSTAELVYYMMGAVAAHKLVISFCVGMELVSSGTRTALIIIYVIAFAIVSPIGIGVGMAVSDQHASEGVANAVLQGLATGTLLYVVFFEILLKEREGGPPGLHQLIAILSGFGVMFGLLMAASEGHSHHHHH
ncbi:zinc transporter ZIP1 [Anabrus simplex]|uniref:zinc transporter ZIP1 n=1 Tax=Anabrus simplex TaxID=316456 RepID=UPI0035A2E85D